MTLTDRLKLLAAEAIERHRDELDDGTGCVYQVNMTIKLRAKNHLPYRVMVGVEKEHEIEGVRVG